MTNQCVRPGGGLIRSCLVRGPRIHESPAFGLPRYARTELHHIERPCDAAHQLCVPFARARNTPYRGMRIERLVKGSIDRFS
jgi:hypothetical protein